MVKPWYHRWAFRVRSVFVLWKRKPLLNAKAGCLPQAGAIEFKGLTAFDTLPDRQTLPEPPRSASKVFQSRSGIAPAIPALTPMPLHPKQVPYKKSDLSLSRMVLVLIIADTELRKVVRAGPTDSGSGGTCVSERAGRYTGFQLG
jgi:hypothetical protein